MTAVQQSSDEGGEGLTSAEVHGLRHVVNMLASAEAALATASREKLRLQDEVEAVVEDMERRADGSGGTYEDAVRRSVCKRYAIDLRAALASPPAVQHDAEVPWTMNHCTRSDFHEPHMWAAGTRECVGFVRPSDALAPDAEAR